MKNVHASPTLWCFSWKHNDKKFPGDQIGLLCQYWWVICCVKAVISEFQCGHQKWCVQCAKITGTKFLQQEGSRQIICKLGALRASCKCILQGRNICCTCFGLLEYLRTIHLLKHCNMLHQNLSSVITNVSFQKITKMPNARHLFGLGNQRYWGRNYQNRMAVMLRLLLSSCLLLFLSFRLVNFPKRSSLSLVSIPLCKTEID